MTRCKQQQPKLRCTVDTTCWCMNLKARIEHDSDECMSPSDILREFSDILTDRDTIYLRRLAGLEFIK